MLIDMSVLLKVLTGLWFSSIQYYQYLSQMLELEKNTVQTKKFSSRIATPLFALLTGKCSDLTIRASDVRSRKNE